ncbi:MAG: UDP-2,4-diacetamido-2,4,6-trideoxy-beta-L-altropyranose hydrolase [Burkholderiaceae bacterium]|nr:MAG: UDP-2,4-diacetamido-2,4,6-trideoxy-beta-L-altropyranose hydrolase [Burkholderiaceae bacterium]
MNIFIRVDASVSTGTGHLMRCLTLADEMKSSGCAITFVCRDLPGNLFALLEQKGYAIGRLPGQAGHDVPLDWRADAAATTAFIKAGGQRADWVIVDHYELDGRWESALRACTGRIMVIDDLADRTHDCDLLLDQNYYPNLESRYEGLVPLGCRKLLGPEYVLLRPEFNQQRERLRKRDGQVRRILIFFGGSDPENLTMTALDAIQRLQRSDIAVDVVVGGSNPYRNEIEQRCRLVPNANYHCQVLNMAELIAEADLAIGAGGAAMWERCILGLPTLTVLFAANQEKTTISVASQGAINYLGWTHQLNAQEYVEAMRTMIASPDKLKAIGDNAMSLMGGTISTGTRSVATALLG